MPRNPEGQLELFDMQNAQAPRPRKASGGRIQFNLRHDQFILIGIGGLIGMTVIFASGVERGKQLVRSERLLQREPAVAVQDQALAARVYVEPPVQKTAVAAEEKLIRVKLEPETPAAAVQEREPVQPEGGYAVQVVTYKTRAYAEKELQRLKDSGEPGFIVSGKEHSVLFVGPFASREQAKEKQSSLRSRYSDCFIKTL